MHFQCQNSTSIVITVRFIHNQSRLWDTLLCATLGDKTLFFEPFLFIFQNMKISIHIGTKCVKYIDLTDLEMHN